MLHGFIHPEQKKQTSKIKRKVSVKAVKDSEKDEYNEEFTIAGLVADARDKSMDIVQLLKEHITVVEVAV